MSVDGISQWPLVVGLPRIITALHKHISRTLIFDDEYNIALPIAKSGLIRLGGQPPDIHTTDPIVRDLQFNGRRPSALSKMLLSFHRCLLLLALYRINGFHKASTTPSIVPGSEDFQLKRFGQCGGNADSQSLSGMHTLASTETFNCRTSHTISRLGANPR